MPVSAPAARMTARTILAFIVMGLNVLRNLKASSPWPSPPSEGGEGEDGVSLQNDSSSVGHIHFRKGGFGVFGDLRVGEVLFVRGN